MANRCRIAVAMLGATLLPLPSASAEPSIVLRSGQQVTLAITIRGDRIDLGAPRLSKLGSAGPTEGEITIGLTPGDATLYSRLIATEKTSVPIDFVATGWVGEIKIDERVLCGRLGPPTETRIGSVSWRVSLHDFTVGKGAECQ